MIKVVYIGSMNDNFYRKGNIAYFFKNVENGQMYKWSTSKNNHYAILQGKEYFIEFKLTDKIEDNAIRVKYAKFHEKLQDGTLNHIVNKKGTYKEWM